MEYRQNADWTESEHPRDSDGKFREKGSAQTRYDRDVEKSEVQTRKWTADSVSERKREKVKLSKREYAIADKARKEKFAEYRRNGMTKQDYVFTDSKFITFTNNSRDNFSIRSVVDIEGNQAVIARIIKEINNERSN